MMAEWIPVTERLPEETGEYLITVYHEGTDQYFCLSLFFITESFNYKGIQINLIDTAGIRDSNDTVEQIGINRSFEAINNSDVILFITENLSLTAQEQEIYDKINKNKLCSRSYESSKRCCGRCCKI